MDKNESPFQEILTRLEKIEQKLMPSESGNIAHFISEHEAKDLLKRGTTWFWNLRKSGFPFTKLGGQVYYDRRDLVAYFEQNKIGGDL